MLCTLEMSWPNFAGSDDGASEPPRLRLTPGAACRLSRYAAQPSMSDSLMVVRPRFQRKAPSWIDGSDGSLVFPDGRSPLVPPSGLTVAGHRHLIGFDDSLSRATSRVLPFKRHRVDMVALGGPVEAFDSHRGGGVVFVAPAEARRSSTRSLPPWVALDTSSRSLTITSAQPFFPISADS